MSQESTKVVYAAIFANLAIAASKFVVALISGSSAMLAEAFHSAADTGNELLLLIGLKRSIRPPDREHPFGHGRELYFWSFVVAISIFAVGGGIAIYEGVNGFLHPHELESATWSYVVLAVSAVFEGYSWIVSLKAINQRRGHGESLIEAVHNSKDPSVFTVLIEDTAALLGLIIAALGVFLSHLFQNPAFDAAASVLIGLVLVAAAGALAYETAGLIVGESVDSKTLAGICETIGRDPAVQTVGKTLTMQLGPEEVLLVADVGFHSRMGTLDLEQAIDRIEREVQLRWPAIKRIYFEAESLSGKRTTQSAT